MVGLLQGARGLVGGPLGSGLGTTGRLNVAARIINRSEPGMGLGGDSFLGILLVQTGLVGSLIAYGFVLTVAAKLWKAGQGHGLQYPLSHVATGLAWAIAAMALTAVLNEAAFAFGSSAFHFLLAGLLVSLSSSYGRRTPCGES